MAVGFYDYDIYLKRYKLLLNLEAMKIANYYFNQKENVSLLKNLQDIKNFDKGYVFRNIPDEKVPFKNIPTQYLGEGVEHLGLVYTNGIYIPMKEEFEKQKPLIQLYTPYLRSKVLDGDLTVAEVEGILNSNFLRLRAGDYEMSLDNLKRKNKVFVYDFEIEKVSDWDKKLKYLRKEILGSKYPKISLVNGFKFTSYENVIKLLSIQGFNTFDVHLFIKETYPEFQKNIKQIYSLVHYKQGIKYYYGYDIKEPFNNLVMREFCLAMNKYYYSLIFCSGMEIIPGNNLVNSSIYKILNSFKEWSIKFNNTRTFREYLEFLYSRENLNKHYSVINSTPYGKLFNSLIDFKKDEIKLKGWYYHV